MAIGIPEQNDNKKDAPKAPPSREEVFQREYQTACRIFGFRMPFTPEEIGILKGALMEERRGNTMAERHRAIHAKNPHFFNALISMMQDPSPYGGWPLINWQELDQLKYGLMTWLDRFLDCVEREADLDADELAIKYTANPRYHGEDGRDRPGLFVTHPFFPVSVWRVRIGGGSGMSYGRFSGHGGLMGYWEWVQMEIQQIMRNVMEDRRREQAEARGEDPDQHQGFFGGRRDVHDMMDEVSKDIGRMAREGRQAQQDKTPPEGTPPQDNEPKA